MNLWIRSQDKKELRPNPNLGIERLESNYYIVDRYSFDKEIILAKYATEERALEVLDEIQELLEPVHVIDLSKKEGIAGANILYEMPESDNK